MPKLYFASTDIAALGQHAYLVYDLNGDLSSLDDQIIYRAGPATNNFLNFGNIIIEPGFLNYNAIDPLDVSEDTLDINESGSDDGGDDTTTDRNYYDINSTDAAQDRVIIENWINSFGSPTVGNPNNGTIDTGLSYHLFEQNSNSVITTALSLIGKNFKDIASQNIQGLQSRGIAVFRLIK